MSDRSERLVAVLAALPGGENLDHAYLAHLSMQIEMSAGFGAVGQLPRAKQVSSARAKAELDTYARLCRDLALHARKMSRTALEALEKDQSGALHPLILADELAKARVAVTELPPLPDKPARVGAGAKVAAEWTTRAATDAYLDITGRPLSISGSDGVAGGPFLDFLSDVFAALGIKASAEAQARKIMEKNRQAGGS